MRLKKQLKIQLDCAARFRADLHISRHHNHSFYSYAAASPCCYVSPDNKMKPLCVVLVLAVSLATAQVSLISPGAEDNNVLPIPKPPCLRAALSLKGIKNERRILWMLLRPRVTERVCVHTQACARSRRQDLRATHPPQPHTHHPGQAFTAVPLPVPLNGLEPAISNKTMNYHYNKCARWGRRERGAGQCCAVCGDVRTPHIRTHTNTHQHPTNIKTKPNRHYATYLSNLNAAYGKRAQPTLTGACGAGAGRE